MAQSKHIYLFCGEAYMANRSAAALKKKLDISHEQLNITSYNDAPKADALIDACAEVPLMSAMRLVISPGATFLSAKGSAEEGRKIAEFLPAMPETTALVFVMEEKLDKRRKLYGQIKQLGEIKEFAPPKERECEAFAIQQAQQNGVALGVQEARLLVEIAGCDYYTIENEMNKLAAYTDGGVVRAADVRACASASLEYNVFAIHGLLVKKRAGEALKLLEAVMAEQRPEMLIGVFASKIRELYKVRAMKDAGYDKGKIAQNIGKGSFIAGKLIEECARFSASALRQGLCGLADLDHAVKSGQKDASLALPDALVKIYLG